MKYNANELIKMLPSDNLAAINRELGYFNFKQLQCIMIYLNCSVNELTIKITDTKGIKWTKKEKQALS